MAVIKKKSVFFGTGSIVQLLGLLVVWLFPIGTIVGIILLLFGSCLSFKFICSNCGNKVEKEVKLCPVCKEVLTKK